MLPAGSLPPAPSRVSISLSLAALWPLSGAILLLLALWTPYRIIALFLWKLIAVGVFASSVYVFGMFLVGRWCGARPKEVSFCLGRPFMRVVFGKVVWAFGLVIGGGFVRFAGMNYEHETVPEPGDFRALPFSRRLPIYLSGPISVLLLGCCFLGVEQSVASFMSGFRQFPLFVLAPKTVGVPLMISFLKTFEASWQIGFGLLCVKMAAYNLLPIPPLSGGGLLLEIEEQIGYRNASSTSFERFRTGMTLLGFALCCIIFLCTVYVFIRALFLVFS